MQVLSNTARETHGAFFTVSDVRQANRDAGHHFFDADTMRFFGSRVVGERTIGGRFFITSERSGFDHSSPRRYTVREAMPDGTVETVGDFNAYGTAAQARAAAKRAAGERHAYYFDTGKHKRSRKVYVVTADDPWAAMAKLPHNAVLRFCGRAEDYMTGPSYTRLEA